MFMEWKYRPFLIAVYIYCVGGSVIKGDFFFSGSAQPSMKCATSLKVRYTHPYVILYIHI